MAERMLENMFPDDHVVFRIWDPARMKTRRTAWVLGENCTRLAVMRYQVAPAKYKVRYYVWDMDGHPKTYEAIKDIECLSRLKDFSRMEDKENEHG